MRHGRSHGCTSQVSVGDPGGSPNNCVHTCLRNVETVLALSHNHELGRGGGGNRPVTLDSKENCLDSQQKSPSAQAETGLLMGEDERNSHRRPSISCAIASSFCAEESQLNVAAWATDAAEEAAHFSWSASPRTAAAKSSGDSAGT